MSIKVALVGLGYASQTFHIPFVNSHTELEIAAVVTSRPELAASLLSGVRVYSDLNRMLSNADIDTVLIASPNEMHFEQSLLCLKAGKHVLVEKPFVTSSPQAIELSELAVKHELVLMAYQNRRWDGDFLTVKQLLNEGILGELKVMESRFDRFRPNVRSRWREQPGAGTGILFDLGAHLIDQAVSLFGFPQAINARCPAIRKDSECCDYFHVQLHYPGLEVILNSSPYCASPVDRFQLHGTAGSYKKTGLDSQEEALKSGLQPGTPEWQTAIIEPDGSLYLGESASQYPTLNGDYLQIYQQFADAISTKFSTEITLQQMIDTIRIIELCEQSHHQNKTIVI